VCEWKGKGRGGRGEWQGSERRVVCVENARLHDMCMRGVGELGNRAAVCAVDVDVHICVCLVGVCGLKRRSLYPKP
jgi:hypothetical protein